MENKKILKLKKRILEKLFKVPVISGRPVIITFRDYQKINGYKGSKGAKRYICYRRFIGKYCPYDILINSKIIKNTKSNIEFYKKIYQENFDENFTKVLLNKKRKDLIENYIKKF